MLDGLEEEEADSSAIFFASVYKDVWDEFNEWDTRYCMDMIRFLATERPRSARRNPSPIFSSQPSATEKWTDNRISRRDSGQDVQKINFYNSGDEKEREFTDSCVVIQAPNIRPTPAYELVRYSRTNVFLGDDPHEMPFVPFVDDESFEFKEYAEMHRYFAWQTKHPDPDSNSFSSLR